MKTIIFRDIKLQVDENQTLSTDEVAKGYGISPQAIREHKRLHSDELLEKVHYIIVKNKFKKSAIKWTLDGVHMLGFFIKSERAKEFRKFTAKLLTQIKTQKATVVNKEDLDYCHKAYYNLERENIELKRAINRITQNQEKTITISDFTDILDEAGYELEHRYKQALKQMELLLQSIARDTVINMHRELTKKLHKEDKI